MATSRATCRSPWASLPKPDSEWGRSGKTPPSGLFTWMSGILEPPPFQLVLGVSAYQLSLSHDVPLHGGLKLTLAQPRGQVEFAVQRVQFEMVVVRARGWTWWRPLRLADAIRTYAHARLGGPMLGNLGNTH